MFTTGSALLLSPMMPAASPAVTLLWRRRSASWLSCNPALADGPASGLCHAAGVSRIAPGRSVFQSGIQRNSGIEKPGHRTAGFGLAGDILELAVINAVNMRTHVQVHCGNGKSIAALLQGHGSSGIYGVGNKTGLTQHCGKSHGETTGMRRTYEFFRIGTGRTLKAGIEAVGIVLERATLRRDGAFALLEVADPVR